MINSYEAMILHLREKVEDLQKENASLRTTIEVYEGGGELTFLRRQYEWLSARLETEEATVREQSEIIENQNETIGILSRKLLAIKEFEIFEVKK